MGLKQGSWLETKVYRFVTFFLVMCAFIIFRAEKLSDGVRMIQSIFTVHNPWVLFDDSLLMLGLDWKEWVLLVGSILFMIKVEHMQEAGKSIRDRILAQPFWFRWMIYMAGVGIVVVFGRYGFGFDAKAFVYGGF